MLVDRRRLLRVIGVGAVCTLVDACQSPPASPTPVAALNQSTDNGWQALVKAAQAENTVVLRGPPTNAVRTNLPQAFNDAFGIQLQYSGGQSSDAVNQMTNERAAGIYSTDVILAGADSMYGSIYGKQLLDPLLPALINADARDASKWPGGKLWFADPEQQYILRLNNYTSPLLQINTQAIKSGSITSWLDLLQPQYTGKIATFDPTSSGAGVSAATYLSTSLGEEYVTHLYIDQKPVFSRDHRQMADWLARGTYPITLALRDVEFQQVKDDGFPVELVPNPPEAPGFLTAGFGLLGLINQAPHPNAARVLVNWLASRQGMEVWSRAQGIPPVRTDIDSSAYPPLELVDPNATYFDSYGWDYVVKDRDQMMKRLQKALGS